MLGWDIKDGGLFSIFKASELVEIFFEVMSQGKTIQFFSLIFVEILFVISVFKSCKK